MMPERKFAMEQDMQDAAQEPAYTAWDRLRDTGVTIGLQPFDWTLNAECDAFTFIYALDIGPLRLSLRWPWKKAQP